MARASVSLWPGFAPLSCAASLTASTTIPCGPSLTSAKGWLAFHSSWVFCQCSSAIRGSQTATIRRCDDVALIGSGRTGLGRADVERPGAEGSFREGRRGTGNQQTESLREQCSYYVLFLITRQCSWSTLLQLPPNRPPDRLVRSGKMQLAIFAPEIQQRVALRGIANAQHFTHQDDVITAVIFGMFAAFKAGQ